MSEKLGDYIVFGSIRDASVARTVKENLLRKGIDVSVYVDPDGMNHLTVKDEEKLPIAIEEYKMAIGVKKRIEIPKEWEEIKKLPLGNLTFAILIICILIFGAGYLLKIPEVYNALMFGPNNGNTFGLIESGEVWRIVTPAFIHFGFMHVLFNLMWWKDLANILENTKGPLFLGFFLIISAALSNILQATQTGANFGGLSGVVYGLLGYLWIYKLINKDSKFYLPKSDIALMIGWFIICFFDVFSFKAANYAHGGGLVMGMLFGFIMGLKDKKAHDEGPSQISNV